MLKGNALVGQSGGPTAVINASLAGVIDQARTGGYERVLGMRHGVQGALQGTLIDLSDLDQAAGLLMIGGWESFHGHGGNWDGTPIAEALPVEISSEDDRINCDQPALVLESESHDITAGLPWADRPPTIGGFNRVISRPGSATILLVQRLQAVFHEGRFEFIPREQDPLLVLGAHGFGFTAALTTDVAPHWVGGLVDWGNAERVTAHAPGSWPIEVGNLYSQFIANLLTWTGQLRTQAV